MKRITAIRHAKSSWAEEGLTDVHRPLNKRGKRAVPVMALHLLNLGHLPDYMISSPAKRAYDTCSGFAGIFGFPKENIKIDDRLYFEGESAIIELLRELPSQVRHAFFFSHEPVISSFCLHMANCSVPKFPTAGVCAMEFEIKDWSQLKPFGETLFFATPKSLDTSL